MKKMLEYQADCIEEVLTKYLIAGRVTGGTVTPHWIRFQVTPELGARVSSIKNLSEELAAALDAPSVRIASRGSAVEIEVPRNDPQPVTFSMLWQGLRDVPPVTAVLGLADDGAPLLVRLDSPDAGHVLIAGETGAGKTELLRTMALSLALYDKVNNMRFVMVDPLGSSFRVLAGLPQLTRSVVTASEDVGEAIISLVRLLELRKRSGRSKPATILWIDDLDELAGENVGRCLTTLLQSGVEFGIHVVAATDNPASRFIKPLVSGNFPVRVVGRTASMNDARVASGRNGSGAERLMGGGDFIAVTGGQLHRFQAAYTPDSDLAELVQKVPKSPITLRVTQLPAVAMAEI